MVHSFGIHAFEGTAAQSASSQPCGRNLVTGRGKMFVAFLDSAILAAIRKLMVCLGERDDACIAMQMGSTAQMTD